MVWRDIDNGLLTAPVGELAIAMLAEKLNDSQQEIGISSFGVWLWVLLSAVLLEDHEDAYGRRPSVAEVHAYNLLAQMCVADASDAIEACLARYKQGRDAAPDPLLNAAREFERDTKKYISRLHLGASAQRRGVEVGSGVAVIQ